ncbi:MAG: TetR/AcrR family transcriptional regulator [Lachnospiraceae bacterium]
MNAKFFDVKKEKQDAIINASLKVFAENGYKKASTDVIVRLAGISKGLLFHYFISKQGLYEFIYDYSVKYMTLELTQSVKKDEKDFFEVLRQIEQAKTRVMKNYPYMQQFLSNVKFEKNSEALTALGDVGDAMSPAYNSIYKQTDMTRFHNFVDVGRVIQMITWMSEGFIKDRFRDPDPNLDEMNAEFGKYLSMLKLHFYKDVDETKQKAEKSGDGASAEEEKPAPDTEDTPIT